MYNYYTTPTTSGTSTLVWPPSSPALGVYIGYRQNDFGRWDGKRMGAEIIDRVDMGDVGVWLAVCDDGGIVFISIPGAERGVFADITPHHMNRDD